MLALGAVVCGLFTASHPVVAQSSVPAPAATPIPEPLVTASFDVPTAQVDWANWPLVGSCESIFARSIIIGLAGHMPLRRQNAGNDLLVMPLPDTAVTAGRQCLARIGGMTTVAPVEWPEWLHFTIGVNDDTLVRSIVARQLALAGTSVRDRSGVLEEAISALIHNQWNDELVQGIVHPTSAHNSLARYYAAQLDTMRPAAAMLAAHLRVTFALQLLDTTAWNVGTALERARQFLQLARSSPLNAVPAPDQKDVAAAIWNGAYAVAELTYLEHPTHAAFTQFLATRDSLWRAQYGKEVTDSLLGHSAGRLDGYWFNVPSGSASPVTPAPGVVTLIEFIDAGDGMTPEDVNARVWATRLRQLQAQYQQMQIVLVSMTHGQFQGKDLWTDPAREAELIHQYLTDQLQLPGMVCVIPMRFHTEPGLTTVPLASPVLDRYHIDPRHIQGHEFLVDASGWIVLDNRTAFNGRYIQRLLAQ